MQEENKSLIYVVEDHDVLRDGVLQYLRLSGFEAQGFATLKDASNALLTTHPELIIQDVMLPDGDGFLFVKNLKEKNDIPVIFMTARGDESDRIMGFELGADDYITKPFSPKELVLRVQAVIRRIHMSDGISGRAHFENLWKDADGNELEFNTSRHFISINSQPVILTAAEWRVVEYLILNHGQLESRDQILERCFDYNLESYERIVDTHIKNLRAKMEGNWIETIRGYGYRFCGISKETK